MLDIPQEHLDVTRQGMWQVVNSAGTAGVSRVPVEGVEVAGKTGTSQVVRLALGDGKNVPWKYRDHGHFVCYAPFDKPKYACCFSVEHGGTSGAATPIARDVLTFLFDRDKAMAQLTSLEEQWGGSLAERTAAFQRRVLEIAEARAAGREEPTPGEGVT